MSILGTIGFRIKPSTILFKGNLKSHIYEVKHKTTKCLFLIIKRLVFMLLLLKQLLIDSIDRCPRKSAIKNCSVQTFELNRKIVQNG